MDTDCKLNEDVLYLVKDDEEFLNLINSSNNNIKLFVNSYAKHLRQAFIDYPEMYKTTPIKIIGNTQTTLLDRNEFITFKRMINTVLTKSIKSVNIKDSKVFPKVVKDLKINFTYKAIDEFLKS
jgi:hypothetical protein